MCNLIGLAVRQALTRRGFIAATREQLLPAGKGFSGELVIGRDLIQIGVG